MKFLRTLLIIFIWLIPISLLGYWVSTLRYASSELKDGSYSIKNRYIEWKVQVTNGVFRSCYIKNRKTNEKLDLNGDDFQIRVGYKKDLGWLKTDEKQIFTSSSSKIISPAVCSPVSVITTKGKTSFIFSYLPFDIIIQLDFICLPNDKYIRRVITLTSQNMQELVIENVSLGSWDVQRTVSGGGQGLPVFVDNLWFASGETPWFKCVKKNHVFQLCHYPSVYLRKEETWTSDSTIIGGGCKEVRDILNEYVRSVSLQPRFFSLYNTWYDIRENDLNASNIVLCFNQLTDKLNTFGAKIDYCVIDDGWFNKDTLYETLSNTFPNGLREVSDNIASSDSQLGLWLSFSGLYLDNNSLKPFGYEEAHSKFFCLSGTNYFNALTNRLTNIIINDHVAFFKHDFNFFGCIFPNHGHLRNLEHSDEANMRQTTKLLEIERNLNTNIIQAITTGINLSPWWLKYVHILWMGGSDISFDMNYPVLCRSEAEMTYRDGRLYELLREKEMPLFLYSLMTHGIIDGRLNSAGPWPNDDKWSDYIMNYLGRGTAIRELYLYHKKLDIKKSEILAKGLKWAEAHSDEMLYSEMILGDPRKNEVYGFRGCDDKGNVYVSIRNPKLQDENISLKEIGLESQYYLISYPYHKICESKSIPIITIPAESVLIVESLNLKDINKPIIINARSSVLDSNDSSTNFIIGFDKIDNNIPVYVYSPIKVKNISGIKVERNSGNFLKLELEDSSYNEPNILKNDISINNLNILMDIPDNSKIHLIVYTTGLNGSLEFYDNGSKISANLWTLHGSNRNVAIIPLGAGRHEITGESSGLSIKIVRALISSKINEKQINLTYKSNSNKNKDINCPCQINQSELKRNVLLYHEK